MPIHSSISSKAAKLAWAAAIAALIPLAGAAQVRDQNIMANPSSAITVALDLRIRDREPILARLQFANVSNRPYQLLSWLTFPGGRIDSKNYFSVTVNGQPAAYTGIMKKRGEPTEADYLSLAPGEALTRVVSLSEAYAIPHPSALSVTYSAINPGLAEDAPGDRLTSNTVLIRLP